MRHRLFFIYAVAVTLAVAYGYGCRTESVEANSSSIEAGGGPAGSVVLGQESDVPSTTPPPELAAVPSPEDSVLLSMVPGDMTSSVGETPLRVNVGAVATAELLAKLATAIELRTYPDLSPVRFNVVTVPGHEPEEPSPEGVANPSAEALLRQHSYLQIVPTSPLRNSWYVLSLKEVPKGLRPVVGAGSVDIRGSAYAVRFHPGSAPTLTRVLLCQKSQKRGKVVFEMSENLHVDPGVIRATFGASRVGGHSCIYHGSGPASDSLVRWVELVCDEAFENSRWEIGFNGGVVPLKTWSGDDTLQREVDYAALPEAAGCRTFVP